jgi:two-component system nitrate/nitrite response regulator NarL
LNISFRRPHEIRVLLVEDNEIYAGAVQLLLESVEGAEVVGRARNGAQGVELALALSPDCVLMDISMPVMDGFEATRIIRERLPDVRIVMLTSSDDSGDRARAEAVGADGYLTKESRLEELAAAVTGDVRERPGVARVELRVAAA